MPEYIKAPEALIHLAAEIIREHHEELQGASIAFVFREEAPIRAGRAVLGEASLIPEKLKPHLNFDFLIWIAQDEWQRASPAQQTALLDQELCHCMYHLGKPKIRPHDVEEFAIVIKRYGAYRRDLERANSAFQWAAQGNLFPGTPTLVAVDPRYFGD